MRGFGLFLFRNRKCSKVSSIEVTNKILLKHFDKQENLIKSKVGTTNKSVLLSKDYYKETLTY